MDERAEICQAMDKIIYWNQFDPSKHHFYKIMKYFRFELRLPKKFATRFPVDVGKSVNLMGPIGSVRGVRVVETDEDVLLREGWGEFMDGHQLNEEDLLVFHYIGDSSFEVLLFDRTGCEKDLRVINDQQEMKPHFFKIMNMGFRSKLLIPRKLVKKFPEKLAGKISLKGPSGNLWEARADWSDGEDVFLGKGWSEFVSDHSLDEFDLLVFRYTGDSLFNVLMFDKSGCEKESSHFVKPKATIQRAYDAVASSRAKGKGRHPWEADNEKDRKAMPPKKNGKMGVRDYERRDRDSKASKRSHSGTTQNRAQSKDVNKEMTLLDYKPVCVK